jgi:hypothetical protein
MLKELLGEVGEIMHTERKIDFPANVYQLQCFSCSIYSSFMFIQLLGCLCRILKTSTIEITLVIMGKLKGNSAYLHTSVKYISYYIVN